MPQNYTFIISFLLPAHIYVTQVAGTKRIIGLCICFCPLTTSKGIKLCV